MQAYKEFVIWGVPPQETEETLLYTLADTLEEAHRVMRILVAKHGVTKAHIQVIDFNKDLADVWRNPALVNVDNLIASLRPRQ